MHTSHIATHTWSRAVIVQHSAYFPNPTTSATPTRDSNMAEQVRSSCARLRREASGRFREVHGGKGQGGLYSKTNVGGGRARATSTQRATYQPALWPHTSLPPRSVLQKTREQASNARRGTPARRGSEMSACRITRPSLPSSPSSCSTPPCTATRLTGTFPAGFRWKFHLTSRQPMKGCFKLCGGCRQRGSMKEARKKCRTLAGTVSQKRKKYRTGEGSSSRAS